MLKISFDGCEQPILDVPCRVILRDQTAKEISLDFCKVCFDQLKKDLV